MPWALSNDGRFVVELASTLREIHRRKNGFTHAVDHLNRIKDSVFSLSGYARPAFEIWEEPGADPIDNKLIEQWSERINSPLHPVSLQDLATRFDKIHRLESISCKDEPNPLLQCESLRRLLAK